MLCSQVINMYLERVYLIECHCSLFRIVRSKIVHGALLLYVFSTK